jgi:hypothetical protein
LEGLQQLQLKSFRKMGRSALHEFVVTHIPNAQTKASIKESEKGKGIKRFQSMDELFEDL